MTGLSIEEELFCQVMKTCAKWQAGKEMTESDARFLLEVMVPVDGNTFGPLPTTLCDSIEHMRTAATRSKFSLAVFANYVYYEFRVVKNVRTLRRWCESGWVPKAKQTKGGGHWRVDWQSWNLEEKIKFGELLAGKGGRYPRSILNTKRWKEFKKKMKPVFRHDFHTLLSYAKVFPHMRASGSPDAPAIPDCTVANFLGVFSRGGRPAINKLQLYLAAKELALADQPITREALAIQLKTSKRNFYRKYEKTMVKQAIIYAKAPSSDPMSDAQNAQINAPEISDTSTQGESEESEVFPAVEYAGEEYNDQPDEE